jgi:hypothetical protein
MDKDLQEEMFRVNRILRRQAGLVEKNYGASWIGDD